MPSVSIIVPVLNESDLIGPFLEHLRANLPDAEIIVVDGDSNDGTAELAGLADRVLRGTCGRARQMNAGTAVARGEVLWFLHADSIVPANALSEITNVLGKSANVGGCFRLRLPGREWIYRISDSLGNLGVHVFGFALGDHGMFCRRDAFFTAGMFPDILLMEDAELYRALRRVGRMRQVSSEIIGNPRRYQDLGPYRTTGYYVLILTLYLVGARISTLMSVYRRLTLPYSANRAGSDPAAGLSRSTTVPAGVRQ